MEIIDVTVYYLEMLATSTNVVPAPRDGLTVIHAKKPTVPYYRFLYNSVGEDYRWLNRRKLSDSELGDIVQHPQTKVYVLHVDGTPAGYAEIDRRQENEIELVQFGLMPEFIGQGLGKWFLQWVIDQVWGETPKRFWLHTCTLDHPIALSTYQKAGFVIYQEEQIRREF